MTDDADYPPEPWLLAGRGLVTAWLAPAEALPAVPRGARPVRIGRHGIAVTAFVDYGDRGAMAYHELLAGVALTAAEARGGRLLGLGITDIWVDSPASRAGGRELWGVPKELADFEYGPTRWSARREGTELATATQRRLPTPALTLRRPRHTHCVQTMPIGTVPTRLSATGRLRPTRVRWSFGDRLSWLRGARPLGSVQVEEFTLHFGPAGLPLHADRA